MIINERYRALEIYVRFVIIAHIYIYEQVKIILTGENCENRRLIIHRRVEWFESSNEKKEKKKEKKRKKYRREKKRER